ARDRPPLSADAGHAFEVLPPEGVAVLELEHLRAPGRCPTGSGMVSAYFVESPDLRVLEESDAALTERAIGAIRHAFPGSCGRVLFAHAIRWESGIGRFPPGRLAEMARLRRRLGAWEAPLDLCGDYLDGLS